MDLYKSVYVSFHGSWNLQFQWPTQKVSTQQVTILKCPTVFLLFEIFDSLRIFTIFPYLRNAEPAIFERP